MHSQFLHNPFQEKVLEMYNMLIGISSEIERIKEEISKRKCYVYIFINVTLADLFR